MQPTNKGSLRLRSGVPGRPRREFLQVDDLAAGVLHLAQLSDPPDWVNVGTGQDPAISELARLVADVVGYRGVIQYDPSRPDGTPVKRKTIERLWGTGWQPRIDLRAGIEATYVDFLRERQQAALRC